MIVADKVRYITTDTGDIEVIFTVSGFNNKRIAQRLVSVLRDKKVELKAKEHRSQRSIDQNDMFWALVGEISQHVNGSRQESDMMNIYSNVLVRANVKRTYMRIPVEAKKLLEGHFRAFTPVPNSKRQEPNGMVTCGYWGYHGSSKFNIKEMTQLIDVALDICTELGLDNSQVEVVRNAK